MYRVLLPIDEDEKRAHAQARAVSNLPTASDSVEVVLLHVFDDEKTAETTTPTEIASARHAMEVLEDARVGTTTESAAGDPAKAIMRTAERVGADAIILGGRKRSTVGSLLFGSVSQTVTLDADRPVMVTGDSVRDPPTHVCTTCGERYYTDNEISKCNNCGGVKVEQAS